MKQLAITLSLCFLFTIGFQSNIDAKTNVVDIVTSIQKNKTVKFKVHGNCGMCKSKIENSLKGVKGVSVAVWDTKTKMITVVYNPKKISLDTIHKKIAAVGYDTEKAKAKDEVYNKLHHCCKYDRPKS